MQRAARPWPTGRPFLRTAVAANPARDSVDWSKVDIREFEFVQPPGPKNVLGIVKFRFPNKHDVYMHDTPNRELFKQDVRAFSHGCVRVQNVRDLVTWLLRDTPGGGERARRPALASRVAASAPMAKASASASTAMTEPSSSSPASSLRAMGSTSSFWITRFRGRAP